MARHWLVLLLWLALQAPGGAQAEALDAARAAYQRGDYDLALQSLRPAAEHGDAAAQFLLGILYYNGQGVERDLAASTRWYLAAARQGHAAAQFNLGNAYRFGRGVAQDLGQALRWWEAAARLGLANASHNLAVHYLQAPRTPAEQALGLAWLRHAAVRGWMDARVALRELDQPWEAGDAPPDPAREPLRSEADLLVLAPGQYTLQLMAGGSLATALDYLRDAGLGARAMVFRLPKGGKLLWVVVYGAYADRAEAQAVIDGIRPDLKANSPWVRRIGEIQNHVREIWRKHEGTSLPGVD